MPCATVSILSSPNRTDYDVLFPVLRVCNNGDIRIVGVCDSVKECEFYNVIDNLVCWLGIFYIVYISRIVRRCLVWGLFY